MRFSRRIGRRRHFSLPQAPSTKTPSCGGLETSFVVGRSGPDVKKVSTRVSRWPATQALHWFQRKNTQSGRRWILTGGVAKPVFSVWIRGLELMTPVLTHKTYRNKAAVFVSRSPLAHTSMQPGGRARRARCILSTSQLFIINFIVFCSPIDVTGVDFDTQMWKYLYRWPNWFRSNKLLQRNR